MDDVIAIILGGGAGTRLFPLTMKRSKPAVPIAGKYRLIDIPISNCINSELERIFVLTQFNSTSLNRHLTRSYQFDRFSKGFVSVLAAEQTLQSTDWFQGTADAVRQSLRHLDSTRHRYKLVLSGDQLYSMDYRKLFNLHVEAEADVTIATIPVTAADATGFGILKTDDDGAIIEFYEKPAIDELEEKSSPVDEEMQQQGRVYLASMGIYLFGRGILHELLAANPTAHDFGKEIIPGALGKYKIMSYPFTGYWSDIGTISSFYDANLMLAQSKPDFDMYNPVMPLYTNARMLPPGKIHDSSITESIIAEAAVINASRVTESVIGLRSYVGPNATIVRTVMMGADYYYWHDEGHRPAADAPERPGVHANSTVENAIIDRNVSVGRDCIIVNRDHVTEGERDGIYFRDGLIVIAKGQEIPDGTII